jgi:hypothetical protein
MKTPRLLALWSKRGVAVCACQTSICYSALRSAEALGRAPATTMDLLSR